MSDFWTLIKTPIQELWSALFDLPFFIFTGVSFGDVIVGLMVIDVSVIVVRHILKKEGDKSVE